MIPGARQAHNHNGSMSPGQDRPRPQAIEWIALVLGVGLTLRYRWLLDDAFVYFRYLDNLLFLRIGLVFNQGEYVEGFSSPGWLLLLLPLRALRLDYWHTVQAIGCGVFVGFWYLLVQLNRRLSPPGAVVNLPLLYLAPNYAVLSYFTSGLESPLVQLMAPVYALYLLDPGSRWLSVAVALSPLIRPELAVPLLLAAAWSWWNRRRFPTLLMVLAASLNGGWLLFRVVYYADLFPNTFYLKNVADPGQGWIYLHETLGTYRFYLVALILAAAVVYRLRRREEATRLRLGARAMMLLLAASVASYVVAIGGDPRHYRFLAFPFVLAACACSGIVERLARPLFARRPRLALPAGLLLLAVFFAAYPPQLDRHPVTRQEGQKRLHKISDASYHRHMRRLEHRRWSRRPSIEAQQSYRRSHPEFRYQGVGAGFWCVHLYQRFDRRIVHALGLTDAFLARTDMPADRPAHKWGLVDLARDLAALRAGAADQGRGMFRRAVERGDAPAWVERNLDTIEVIEKKVSNHHDLGENLRLAVSFPGKLEP